MNATESELSLKFALRSLRGPRAQLSANFRSVISFALVPICRIVILDTAEFNSKLVKFGAKAREGYGLVSLFH